MLLAEVLLVPALATVWALWHKFQVATTRTCNVVPNGPRCACDQFQLRADARALTGPCGEPDPRGVPLRTQ